jgi:hypothetical protein
MSSRILCPYVLKMFLMYHFILFPSFLLSLHARLFVLLEFIHTVYNFFMNLKMFCIMLLHIKMTSVAKCNLQVMNQIALNKYEKVCNLFIVAAVNQMCSITQLCSVCSVLVYDEHQYAVSSWIRCFYAHHRHMLEHLCIIT